MESGRISTEPLVTFIPPEEESFHTAAHTGSAARFNGICGVAIDTSGNLFVVDQNNYTIRKVTPSGVVTTLAGTAGIIGSADGTGGAAHFNLPWGIAVDASGNAYVGDSGNNTIREITPAGVVTTLAGTAGGAGFVDGTGSAARFHLPDGVAVDTSGNVYVVDNNNAAIRKITPSGVVTTLAGGSFGSADGTGSAAQFHYPVGVAVDSAGNLFVSDLSSTIRKITSTGVVTTIAGNPGTSGSAYGTGTAALFKYQRPFTRWKTIVVCPSGRGCGRL